MGAVHVHVHVLVVRSRTRTSKSFACHLVMIVKLAVSPRDIVPKVMYVRK